MRMRSHAAAWGLMAILGGVSPVAAQSKKAAVPRPAPKRPARPPQNPARELERFQKMSAEWGQFDLGSRIKEIDLSSMSEPKVTVEDSGVQIPIALQKENFGKILKTALEAIAGKGEKIKSVNAAGVYPVIEYAGN